MRFHFVDVFADEPLHGNPLALIENADHLDETTMRAIAREFNQSETTFLLRPTRAEATVRLRSFTPTGAEVFGAGHNALGAWLWLAESGTIAAHGAFAQEIGDDVLPVEVTRSTDGRVVVAMTQSPPRFGASIAHRGELARSLGLADTDLVPGRPAHFVSTGAGHLLVPLTGRAAVDAATPDAARLSRVLHGVGAEGCYLYSLDPVDPTDTAYARFFNPIMGISEDPATGTAAGPLIASLVVDGTVADGATAIVEQGYALGRPSRVRVSVTGDVVRVSGSGILSAEGTLLL